ncbi:MAG: apolipoprotein N-acyltransferase [Pirellulaceae bacterium]|nr:apolipoprotein N-acyltransferase [Pirellulaceae bacterium]
MPATIMKREQRKPALAERAGVADPSRPPGLLTLGLALAGSLLLWASFPPLGLWPLAWIAPLPWLVLVQLPALPGRRPYVSIWLAGLLFWLLILQGIRLAHPLLIGGWIALSLYLSFYVPIFVGLARVAVQRLRIPLVFAAPVVWVGLELIRGHLFTGFSLSLLAATQVRWPLVLQIADLGGAYGVSFVMMLVTACLAKLIFELWKQEGTSSAGRWWPLAVAVLVLGATLLYGKQRLGEVLYTDGRPPLRVALIQGALDTVFEMSPERIEQTLAHYRDLTDQARRQTERLDLIVWPESALVVAEWLPDEPLVPPPDAEISADELRRRIAEGNETFELVLQGLMARANALPSGQPQSTPTLVLAGTTTLRFGAERPRNFNTALLAGANGQVLGRYHKMHAVMFGEYVPLADRIPLLAAATPLGSGMSVGTAPVAFDVAGHRLAPSICFESVVPHLIRRQVVELEREGQRVDALVNITNDGWFWGSAILDHHLACAVLRAVENRKPLVVAANTGISAWIDGNGRVVEQAPRREARVIVADLRPDGRESPYHLIGDVPANLCGLACVLLAFVGGRRSAKLALTGPARK